MAQTSTLSDNLTAGSITKTDLKYLVSNIFAGKQVPELDAIGTKSHPSGKSNLAFHNSQIQEQINKVCSTPYEKLDYVLSRISLGKTNKVNIDVHVQKSGSNIKFYFVGPDLRDYFMYLPRLGPSNPHTGTSHSKWYGIECRTRIEPIVLKLRLLELLLFGIRISETYNVSSTGTGILGLEVPITIPELYNQDPLITCKASLTNSANPTKMSDGLYLFGKNGVRPENTSALLDILRLKFAHLECEIYPTVIRDWDLSAFVSSDYRFALCSWNNHARILVQSCRSVDVLIIDPWMNGLPRVVSEKLGPANPTVLIGFLSRTIKDQKGEGSCVFCALARLVSLVDASRTESPDKAAAKPVDDFYAYLVKTVYSGLLSAKII